MEENDVMAAPTSLLENLPPELLTQILGNTDVPSLNNMAQASRFLNNVCTDEIVVSKMILRQIGPEVLPDAYLAHHAPLNVSGRISEVKGWCEKHLRQRPSATALRMNLKTANAIWSLHQDVCAMVPIMIKEAATFSDELEKSLGYFPPSELEIARFHRAMYGFQIFNRLTGPRSRFSATSKWGEHLRDVLYEYYSYVDVAQQTCITEMLSNCAVTVFNDVAREDIVWGMREKTERPMLMFFNDQAGESSASDPWLQYIITAGLQGVCKLLTSVSYDDRSRALSALQPGWGTRKLRETHIVEHIQTSMFPPELWSPAQFNRGAPLPPTITVATALSYPDPDQGPEDAVRSVRNDSVLRGQTQRRGSKIYRVLRGWGYAMWDMRRLNLIGEIAGQDGIKKALAALKKRDRSHARVEFATVAQWNRRRMEKWYNTGMRGRCPEGWPENIGAKFREPRRLVDVGNLIDREADDVLQPPPVLRRRDKKKTRQRQDPHTSDSRRREEMDEDEDNEWPY